MTATLELRNDALMAIMVETPEYRELVLKAKAIQANAINESYEVKSLGATLTLKEVAQTYQAFKGLGTWFFHGDNEARKESFSYKVSRECLAIIKKTGYKADPEGIKNLINA
jgi:hypothetical protein